MSTELTDKLKKMVGDTKVAKCEGTCKKVTHWTFCIDGFTFYWQCDNCGKKQYVKR